MPKNDLDMLMDPSDSLPPGEVETRLLEALASLNQISAAINRIGSAEVISSAESLQQIVESAMRVVPGASAAIYIYDERRAAFERESRVYISAPDFPGPVPAMQDAPRPQGMGQRALHQRRPVLSYEEPDLPIHPYHAALGTKTVGCFPLIVAEQTVGALYVYLREARPFSRLELLLLENFVHQAAMAIYHTRRQAAMRRSLERNQEELNRLRRAGMLLSSRLRLEETLESILQWALEMTNAHYGIFRLLDKTGENLITRAFAGAELTRPKIETLPLSVNSVMGFVARSRQPLLIPDLLTAPWNEIYYPLDARLQMRSELAVPLINASGRLEGVLNLESPERGAFDENHLQLIQSFAAFAVIAIQEARLLDVLQETARLIFSLPCQQALERLNALACDLLNASASGIWLSAGSELRLQASAGPHRLGEILPLNASLAGAAIRSRQPVSSDDVTNDPRVFRQDLAQSQNFSRALVVPLLTREGATPPGAFAVFHSQNAPGAPAESDWDTKVLTLLAHYAALALQNEDRQQALRSAQEQRAVAETFAAVGDIASNLLHHLNNKIGIIPVRVQSIEEKCQPALSADPYLTRNLTEIEHCAAEAMQTVRQNLVHLRPIQLEPVEVAARVQEALRAAHLPASLQVKTAGLENLPLVMAGAQSLTFVFTNLIENAAEAMRGQGVIRLEGRAAADWVEITVSDSGPGIAPELHNSIFELNYSGRSGSRPGKLGFGLWWVKTLVNRLGGSISLQSDGQHGAAFSLRLPRLKEIA